jgi:hypothetical protein
MVERDGPEATRVGGLPSRYQREQPAYCLLAACEGHAGGRRFPDDLVPERGSCACAPQIGTKSFACSPHAGERATNRTAFYVCGRQRVGAAPGWRSIGTGRAGAVQLGRCGGSPSHARDRPGRAGRPVAVPRRPAVRASAIDHFPGHRYRGSANGPDSSCPGRRFRGVARVRIPHLLHRSPIRRLHGGSRFDPKS